MKKKTSLYSVVVLVAGIIVLLNLLSDTFFLRLDFTADKRYTLSKATKDILKNLDRPVTVKAYFTRDLPPNIATTRRDFKDLLTEYSRISHGMVQFTFIDPNQSPESEQEAVRSGVQPLVIDSREKDKIVQKKAYLGAVVQYGEKNDVIPLMQPGAPMEYNLSTSIKKLTVTTKPSVAFIQNAKAATLTAMPQVNQAASVLNTTVPVYLSDSTNALESYQTAVFVDPQDSLPAYVTSQLDRFLSKGGNLIIAFDRVNGNLSSGFPMGSSHNTGLEKWLKEKGIDVREDFITDINCNHIGVRQQGLPFTISVAFPYFPNITTFADHPVVKGLEEVALPFASSIVYTGDSSHTWIPLAMTSEKSGRREVPVYFDINYQWKESDFPEKNLVVAGLLKNNTSPDKKGQIMVVSSGKFCVNGEGENAMQLNPDNVNLLVNAIDYLNDQSGLIELRTKTITSRPLKEISEGKRTFLKFFNFLFPVFLAIGYGIFRMEKNRSLRIKRMEENYV